MKKKVKLAIIVSVVVASASGIFAHIIKRKRARSSDIKDMDDVEIAEGDFDDEVIVIPKQEEFTDDIDGTKEADISLAGENQVEGKN